MKLTDATGADIKRLMSWFPDERSTGIWGGPKFRYPFTSATFEEDVQWREIDTFCLIDPGGVMRAFGQLYERHGRINLARLVVSPQRRRQGLGTRLVGLLMLEGRQRFPLREFSLYVCKDNHPARACYTSLGFEEQESPDGGELADSIIYMTRPV